MQHDSNTTLHIYSHMNIQHKPIKILLLLPFMLSLLYLATALLHLLNENVASILEALPFPLFTIILTIALIVIEIKYTCLGWRLNFAYTMPGFMAATAIFNAWTLVPSHLGGVAWGGLYYFLETINQYPDIGPINSTILIGIIAMLCTCYVPVIIAWGYLSYWPKRVMIALILLFFMSYLFVAIYLDFNLWLAGLYGTEQDSLIFLLYGPISRVLSLISTAYLTIRLIFDSN